MAFNTLKNKKILITCGPTWVPIDRVRVISNISSGSLGQTLAENLAKLGARVTLIEGQVKKPLQSKKVRIHKFAYFDELSAVLNSELKKRYHVVIHAAAVSDYKVKNRSNAKISSGQKRQTLTLIPTHKLINGIKRKNKEVFLVGFKLDTKFSRQSLMQKVKKLFSDAKCDLVVANTLSPNNKYTGMILNREQKILAKGGSRSQIVKHIIKSLRET